MNKIYFPNLNGLRFVAAMLVLIHHLEFTSPSFDKFHWYSHFTLSVGKLGVILFFTLSGFLITYLLLAEKEITSTISLKFFYIRRILRIWPLYFFIVLSALFVLPHVGRIFYSSNDIQELHRDFALKSTLLLTILPNINYAFSLIVPFAVQAWSIGVEEQFYLSWPLILRKFTSIAKVFIYVIFIYLGIYFLIIIFQTYSPTNTLNQLLFFWRHFCIDCMAIGGLFAYIAYKKKPISEFFQKNFIYFPTLIITMFLLLKGVVIPYLNYEIYSILFGVIIYNFACNKLCVINLENNIFNYLGKISYGLYMYHILSIHITAQLNAMFFRIQPHAFNQLYFYITSILITILISTLSYELFEKRFIKAGKTETVQFKITVENLKFYNQNMHFIAEPGIFKVFVGTSSAKTNEAGFELID